MTRILTLTLIFFINYSWGQTGKEKKDIEKETAKALAEWFKNPSFKSEQLDTLLLQSLTDSGRFENNLKEGQWTEFTIDSSDLGKQYKLVIGDKEFDMDYKLTILKEVGNYSKGLKTGKWTIYKTYSNKLPFYWEKKSETYYENGLKNGHQIYFQINDTFAIRTFKDDVPHGWGKIFDINYPYNLQKIIYEEGEDSWLIKSFYPSGKIEVSYTDTVIENKEVKYLNQFYENGQLMIEGGYINGSLKYGTWVYYYENGKIESIKTYSENELDGIYKYFHDNGQLWTERIYNDGKLWNIISNYDRKGKKLNPGSLKNGTGTVNSYDTKGKLKETKEYIDGIKK